MFDNTTHVPARALSALLGISDRQIRRLATDGVIPKQQPEGYPLVDCVQAYIAYKIAPVTTDAEGNVIDINEQKARKTKLEADRLEHMHKIDRGEYGSVTEFERLTAKLLQQLRLHMLAIANELKEISGVKGKKGEAMDAKLIEGFNQIAEMPLE